MREEARFERWCPSSLPRVLRVTIYLLVACFRCCLHDERVEHANVINVVRCLNPAEEALFPNPLKTQVRPLGKSAFNLDRMHKHADPIFTAAQNCSFAFIIRKKT